jgi:hypothetical protein
MTSRVATLTVKLSMCLSKSHRGDKHVIYNLSKSIETSQQGLRFNQHFPGGDCFVLVLCWALETDLQVSGTPPLEPPPRFCF